MPLTKKQINEIREHLEKAANPVFYFDNDQDGLCSYLLLRRYLGRGKGVPVKTSPMGEDYFRRVKEFDSDYIFILDQPTISEGFFERVRELNLPIVWIDHHETNLDSIPDFVGYYNPLYNRKKSNEPVTALCYEIVGNKNESWIGTMGCVADKFYPKFYSKFLKAYPDLGIKSKEPFEIFYNSEIGRLARMIGAGLKDRTTNVMKMISFLINSKNPYELIEKNKDNKILHERFEKIDSKFQSLVDKAIKEVEGNVLFFKYSGETSMSADISNRLSHEFPKKYIFVAFVKGSRVNVSTRGKNIKEKVLEIISRFNHATGGGHDGAVGVQINLNDLENFREKVEEAFG